MAQPQQEYKDRLRKFSDRNKSSSTPSTTSEVNPAKSGKSSSKGKTTPTPKEKEKIGSQHQTPPNTSISPSSPQDNTKGEMTEYQTLKTLIENLTTTVTELKSEIAEIKTSKSTTDNQQEQISSNKLAIDNSVKQNEADALQVKLLSAIVIRQDSQIKSLTREVEDLKRQNKVSNIIINNLFEVNEEKTNKDRIKLAQAFFKDKMEIQSDIRIKSAYRFGNANPHSLMVVLENSDDKFIIFAHSSNLKGKTNARRRLYFVNSDQTEQQREDRKYLQQLRKDNAVLDEEDQFKIDLKKGKLFVNNTMIKPEIEPPTARDVLTLNNQELQAVKDVKIYESARQDEGGSEFFCYFQRVKSPDDVQQGLMKVKIKHGDADHVVAAYCLSSPKGPFNQGFCDDGEVSAGRYMLDALKLVDIEGICVYCRTAIKTWDTVYHLVA